MTDHPQPPVSLSWIMKAPGAPYFITDNGDAWTPIGQNDAITWPDLAGAFQQKNLPAVQTYFRMLGQSGVTCIRLMLEYCEGQHRYFERPMGTFQPNMIRLWDDIFTLAEQHSIRILLTPYDTYWMWRRWQHHPYNLNNGGRCIKRSRWLTCPHTRAAIKGRLAFATARWGSSGALFAWDLWNEIRPAHGGNSAKHFIAFVYDIAGFLRTTELDLYGRAHLQTVSVFTPTLGNDHLIAETIFRHPALDFATVHFYEKNTIDRPRNTVDAALTTGRLTRDMLDQIVDDRPFFDSEHGPIFNFNYRGKTLPEAFDDEYFRHMQWAHLASGGAGGGMRWPYRFPHTLTAGMRKSQLSLSRFIELLQWTSFHRRSLHRQVEVSDAGLAVFACGDDRQAIIWLLRINATGKDGMINKAAPAQPCSIRMAALKGTMRITLWNTLEGIAIATRLPVHTEGVLLLNLAAVQSDIAIAVCCI